MTAQEFSDQFSTLLNSYGSQPAFGNADSRREIILDEYEKSVYLTQAQDAIVRSYLVKTTNQQGLGVDDDSLRQVDFSDLITSVDLPLTRISSGTGTVTLPADMEYILNETLVADGKPVLIVRPITAQEYSRLMSQPYSKPLKKQAWRLIGSPTKLIAREDGSYTYTVRYIRKPKPILLASGIPSVDGTAASKVCELPASLHMEVVRKAVELVYASRGGNIQANKGGREQ